MSKSTKHSHLFTTLSLATALATSQVGCAGDMDAEQPPDDSEGAESVTYGLTLEDESNVVASFDAPDGRQIKFLEPLPGLVEIITARRPGRAPLASPEEVSTTRPDQLYERLSGKKAPSKLQALGRTFKARPLARGRTTPSVQAESGAENNLGQSSQALFNFDDSWLFGPNGTLSCFFGDIIIRNSRVENDLYQADTRHGGFVTVFNTGVEGTLTGSFKYRNSFTWSGGTPFTVQPNTIIDDYAIENNGLHVKYDIKTYVKPNGSSYTACQYGIF